MKKKETEADKIINNKDSLSEKRKRDKEKNRAKH